MLEGQKAGKDWLFNGRRPAPAATKQQQSNKSSKRHHEQQWTAKTVQTFWKVKGKGMFSHNNRSKEARSFKHHERNLGLRPNFGRTHESQQNTLFPEKRILYHRKSILCPEKSILFPEKVFCILKKVLISPKTFRTPKKVAPINHAHCKSLTSQIFRGHAMTRPWRVHGLQILNVQLGYQKS